MGGDPPQQVRKELAWSRSCHFWGIVLILAVGAGLRLARFAAVWDHDEAYYALTSLRFVTGDFNPLRFEGPAGPMHFGVAFVYFVAWLVSAPFAGWGPAGFAAYGQEHLQLAVELGRVLSLACGLTTVALTGWLTSRLFSRPAGLAAMAFLAVSPLHVNWSTYFHKEIYCTLFLVVLCCQAFLMLERETSGRWMGLGCTIGLLVGMKVTYVVALLIPLGIHVVWLTRQPPPTARPALRRAVAAGVILLAAAILLWSRYLLPLPPRGSVELVGWMRLEHLYGGRDLAERGLGSVSLVLLALAVAALISRRAGDWLVASVVQLDRMRFVCMAVATFLVFNPYFLLTPVQALATLLVELAPKSVLDRSSSFERALSYLRHLSFAVLGSGVEPLGLAAMGWIASTGGAVQRLLGAYSVSYLLLLASAPMLREYWLLSLLPLLYAFAAGGLEQLLARATGFLFQRPAAAPEPSPPACGRANPHPARLALGLAVVLLLLPGLRLNVANAKASWLPDTRTLATEWMLEHVPKGTKICWTWYSLLPPMNYWLIEDIRGEHLDEMRRLGCRYALVSDAGMRPGLPLAGALEELRKLPAVWHRAGDGREATGPKIWIYKLESESEPSASRTPAGEPAAARPSPRL
jgi:hypothetical protein